MTVSALNHYRIAKALGRGGMGEVYLAEDTRLKRQVAIKILPSAVQADPVRLERFEREAQAVAALNHPNIVTVHSVEQSGETHFITMEYVEGHTLADIIARGRIPLHRLLHLATQIADAIVAAHSHGIVHRDLKPANVMVAAADRVKVLDFGLAKFQEFADEGALPTRELTGEGKIVGTVAYMSPEQAEGRVVDERSDIFSFGVILYELATGERPFVGDTSLSVLSSILRDTPRPVTDLNPAMPRDIARIIRHCLAKDPEQRYQSAKDLRHDLDDLRQSLSSGEVLAAAPQNGAPRRPSAWLIAATTGAALVALSIFIVWRSQSDTAVAVPPSLAHSRLTQREGIERFPSMSPDGKWVLYVADGDIYLQSVSGQTAINLTQDSPSADSKPAFSPDGETIAFRSGRNGGGIFLMGRTGESVRRLTNGGFDPAWFPDGKTIVYAGGEGTAGPENRTLYSDLWIVPAAGGEPRQIFPGDAVQPRVSPSGKRIAFWSIPSDPAARRLTRAGVPANRDIWTVDSNGGSPRRVTDHEANDWNPVWSPDGRWLYFLSNRAGSMNLWRVAIDESSGEVAGDPQPLTAPAAYVADFSLSADGSIGAYASMIGSSNIARVSIDPTSLTAKGDAEMITTGSNDFAYLDVTADGAFAAVTTSSRIVEDLYVVTVANGSMRQLTRDFGRDRYPRWSPDARQIFFASDRRGYQLWRINVDGGSLQELTTSTSVQPLSILLSPDGSRLAATHFDRRELLIYDTKDFSKPLQVVSPPVEPRGLPPRPTDWSADGRFLAITPQGASGVWIYSFEDNSARRIVDGLAGSWFKDGRHLLYARGGNVFTLDLTTGVSSELFRPAGLISNSAPRLAAADTQLFFLQGSGTADIWLVRFAQPDKSQ